MSATGGQPELRAEAQPRRWHELSPDQRKCVIEVNKLLLGMPPASPAAKVVPSFLPQIDAARPSNVILIDGGRGSGKTTVLLTVLDLWVRLLTGEEPLASLRGVVQGGASLTEAPSMDELEGLCGCLRAGRRPVPIRILDLQPLPASAGLLTFLIAGFYDIVSALAGGLDSIEAAGTRPAFHPRLADSEPASLRLWRDLLEATSIGWDGDVSARAATLDPESFVAEREEAERLRMSVTAKWSEFGKALRADMQSAWRTRFNFSQPPVIVVPIDDADLNPAKASELIDLLRKLQHPDIVFLLTGDSELFRRTLLHTIAPPLRGPRGGTTTSDSLLLDLVEQTYSKAIPSAQRLKIAPLSPASRFQLLAAELATAEYPKSDLSPRNLHEHLELNPQARPALPDRFRGISNLGQTIRNYRPHAVEVFRILWWEALESEPMSIAERSLLRSAIRFDDDGSIAVDSRKMGLKLVMSPQALLQGPHARLELQTVERCNVGLGKDRSRPVTSARIESLLLLAYDLADFVGGASLGDALPAEATYLLDFAQATRNGFRTVCWPCPVWRSPIDFMVASRAWGTRLKRLGLTWPAKARTESEVCEVIPRLALEFLSLHLDVLTQRADASNETSESAPGSQDWETMAARLKSAAQLPPVTPRIQVARDWALQRAILIAAPECGLPAEHATSLLRAFTSVLGTSSWEALRPAIVAERRAFASAEGTPAPTNLERRLELMDQAGDHAWSELVENRIPEEVEQLLGSVYVSTPVRSPHGLQGYLKELEGLEAVARGIPIAAMRKALRAASESGGGAAREAVESLWQVVVGQLDGALVGAIGGGPRLDWTEWGQRLHIPYRWEVVAGQGETWQGPCGPLRFSRTAGVQIVVKSGAQIPPVARATLLLAATVAADEEDALPPRADLGVESARAARWSVLAGGLRTANQKGHVFGWPIPAWEAPLDHIHFGVTWNRIAEWLERRTLALPEATLIAAVRSWIDTVYHIANNRSASRPHFSVNSTMEQIQQISKSCVENWSGVPADSTNRRVVNQRTGWGLHDATLFAAPESGLPDAFAKAWLAGRRYVLSGDVLDQVREARLDRTRTAITRAGSTLDAGTLLKEIDATSSHTHPWYEIFPKASQ